MSPPNSEVFYSRIHHALDVLGLRPCSTCQSLSSLPFFPRRITDLPDSQGLPQSEVRGCLGFFGLYHLRDDGFSPLRGISVSRYRFMLLSFLKFGITFERFIYIQSLTHPPLWITMSYEQLASVPNSLARSSDIHHFIRCRIRDPAILQSSLSPHSPSPDRPFFSTDPWTSSLGPSFFNQTQIYIGAGVYFDQFDEVILSRPWEEDQRSATDQEWAAEFEYRRDHKHFGGSSCGSSQRSF